MKPRRPSRMQDSPEHLPMEQRPPQTPTDFSKTRRARVLFLCVGNACRSPMAEALARHWAPDVIVASSAGLAPLGYLSSGTREALAEIGVSCDGQDSKAVRDQDMAAVDLLINLTGRSVENLFDLLPPVEEWQVADPFGQNLECYRRTRDEIERRVLDLAARLRSVAAPRA